MSVKEPMGIFVAGTDTGVGKTLVAAGLVRLARNAGRQAVGIKPVETGCELREGHLEPEDGKVLWNASDRKFSLDQCCPFRFSLPAAPARAAKAEGRSLSLASLEEHIRAAFQTADFVIVEGAGGLMVPIEGRLMMIDLIERLGFPTILVARTRLGTINHTLLSVAALRNRNLPVLGIVLSCTELPQGPEQHHTPGDLREQLDTIPVFVLPYLEETVRADPVRIADVLESSADRSLWHQWIGIS